MNRLITAGSLCLAALLSLAACHEQAPPTPSAEQADQLNDAEAMLNGVDQNQEGPADRSTGPSNDLR